MSRVRRDKMSLYIKFRGTFARPIKKGQTASPLAPSGTTLIREGALVEVELVLGDNLRLRVKVVPDGDYIIAEGKTWEIWHLDEAKRPLKKKTKWQGKKGKQRGKTKRPVQTRDVDRPKSGGKKVGKKRPNRRRRNRSHLGRSQSRSS